MTQSERESIVGRILGDLESLYDQVLAEDGIGPASIDFAALAGTLNDRGIVQAMVATNLYLEGRLEEKPSPKRKTASDASNVVEMNPLRG